MRPPVDNNCSLPHSHWSLKYSLDALKRQMLGADMEPDKVIVLSPLTVGQRYFYGCPAFILIMETGLTLGYLTNQVFKVTFVYKMMQTALFTEVHQGGFHFGPAGDRVGAGDKPLRIDG